MSKPYTFDSPLVTQNTLSYVADIIKTNYAKKEELTDINDRLESLETTLEGLDATLAQIAADLESMA